MSGFFTSMELNEPRFLDLLGKMVGEAEQLQNNPAQGLIPREDNASDHVLEVLKPYTKENGGVLEVERISFVEGRGNVIIKYPGTTDEVISFVGSHLDVVPADPATWERNPFKLTIEGDELHGRGSTDCLGHVALLTDFLVQLAEAKPVLKQTIVVIFIANEENATFVGVGIDQLGKEGYMESLKKGPLYWIDAADSQPCIGTCGALQWEVKCTGKMFHSGLPHKGINAIEFAMDTANFMQRKFYKDFPQHPMELKYDYATSSNFKVTQISSSPGALNQLAAHCTLQGDCRLVPFYNITDVQAKLTEYVAEINANPSILEDASVHGAHSKYKLSGDNATTASCELRWIVSFNLCAISALMLFMYIHCYFLGSFISLLIHHFLCTLIIAFIV